MSCNSHQRLNFLNFHIALKVTEYGTPRTGGYALGAVTRATATDSRLVDGVYQP